MEKGCRGAISVISHRYAKANHTDLPDYDPKKKKSQILYVDANNLYGWSMSKALPTHGFRWLNEDEIADLDVNNIPDDGENGCFLEVDLEYCKHLMMPTIVTPWLQSL